jgi:hypothetical protein
MQMNIVRELNDRHEISRWDAVERELEWQRIGDGEGQSPKFAPDAMKRRSVLGVEIIDLAG